MHFYGEMLRKQFKTPLKYKAGKDFARGDTLCGSLCCVSIGCETVAGVLVWFPFQVKLLQSLF